MNITFIFVFVVITNSLFLKNTPGWVLPRWHVAGVQILNEGFDVSSYSVAWREADGKETRVTCSSTTQGWINPDKPPGKAREKIWTWCTF